MQAELIDCIFSKLKPKVFLQFCIYRCGNDFADSLLELSSTTKEEAVINSI